MSDHVRVSRSCVIPESEFRFRFTRSGGPGGQNVNKRDTQVELIFDVDGSPSLGPRQRERILAKLANRIDAEGRLRLVVSDQRTQGRNREIAVERFCKLLADALKPDPPKRRATKPSRRAVDRRIRSKKIRGERKRSRGRPDDD
ncbi:MAG: alternative ribosome rescue aminoacyl-tRNA hydrolase ArfB [Actinomycetota bacterium]